MTNEQLLDFEILMLGKYEAPRFIFNMLRVHFDTMEDAEAMAYIETTLNENHKRGWSSTQLIHPAEAYFEALHEKYGVPVDTMHNFSYGGGHELKMDDKYNISLPEGRTLFEAHLSRITS